MYQTKDDGSNVFKTRLLKLVVCLYYFNANVDFKAGFWSVSGFLVRRLGVGCVPIYAGKEDWGTAWHSSQY